MVDTITHSIMQAGQSDRTDAAEKAIACSMMANGGHIATHALFEPARNQARAIDRDQSSRGLFQGAQRPCCNPSAVYMAATEITPAPTREPLSRGSQPTMVRVTMANGVTDMQRGFNPRPSGNAQHDREEHWQHKSRRCWQRTRIPAICLCSAARGVTF